MLGRGWEIDSDLGRRFGLLEALLDYREVPEPFKA